MYPEQLYRKMLADAEVTPPGAIWQAISTQLDELTISQNENLPNRLANAEILPPADAWQSIELRLNEVQAFQDSAAMSSIPDLSKWALPLPLVQTGGDEAVTEPNMEEGAVIPMRTSRRPVWLAAASVLVLALLTLVWRQTMQKGYRFDTASQKIEPVKKVPQQIAPTVPQNSEDDPEYSYDANSQEYLVEGINPEANDAARANEAKKDGALVTRPLADDSPVSPKLYVLATLPDGKTVLMSKRIASMLQSKQLTVDEHALLINSRLDNWRTMVDNWLLQNGHPADLSDPVSLARFLDSHR